MANKNKEKEQIENGTQRVESVFNIMEKISDFINKHGLKGTFTTLLIFFIAAFVGYVAFNPEKVFDKFEEIRTEKHNSAVKARLDADPKIRDLLLDLRNETKSDRVYILETHNGGTNLTNLPFLYVDLTYVEPKTTFSWLEMEYNNLRLSRYPWAAYVYNNNFWFGPISDVEKEDAELYYRLQKEEVGHMGMIMMYGKDAMPSGTLGVVYNSDTEPLSIVEISRVMQKYATIISGLLSNDIY